MFCQVQHVKQICISRNWMIASVEPEICQQTSVKSFLSDENPVNNSQLGKFVATQVSGNWINDRARDGKEQKNDANSRNVMLMWINVLLCLTLHFPASPASSQPLSPVTSALISGVVILGMVGTAFFLLSVYLLRKSRLQTVTSSGLWNPTFKWLNINFSYMLGKVLKKYNSNRCMCTSHCTQMV